MQSFAWWWSVLLGGNASFMPGAGAPNRLRNNRLNEVCQDLQKG